MLSQSDPVVLPDVSLARIYRIQRAFFGNQWLGNNTLAETTEAALNACCWIASQLDHDQFELFADLLARFIRIDLSQYEPALSAALEQAPPLESDKARYFAIPLLAPDDIGKAKSSTSLPYVFKQTSWPKSSKFRGFRLDLGMSADDLVKNKPKKGDIVTFVLDDFIGTGDTAFDFLDDYEANYKYDNETVIFLSIAAMKSGYDRIQSRGYSIYYHWLIEKGIGDNSTIADKDRAYALIDQIEDLIALKPEYHRGYNASEALITLLNTPNNTFPMFWARNLKIGGQWQAPFPRRQ